MVPVGRGGGGGGPPAGDVGILPASDLADIVTLAVLGGGASRRSDGSGGAGERSWPPPLCSAGGDGGGEWIPEVCPFSRPIPMGGGGVRGGGGGGGGGVGNGSEPHSNIECDLRVTPGSLASLRSS